VVEGYQTMLDELDAQLDRLELSITHVIVPVGCGSIAQAVTQHFKSAAREQRLGSTARVLIVEPDTAACLRTSLEHAEIKSVTTGDSNMCGMNCGTLSTLAWPILQAGVDGAVVVTDNEAHDAVGALDKVEIKAGPCGAATLAALRKACDLEKARLGLTEESVVVLLNTESARKY
jgi:diaminopropionate ammonia-lyase